MVDDNDLRALTERRQSEERESEEFRAGAPVYDLDGAKIGKVSAQGVQDGALVIQEGKIIRKALTVPLGAIHSSDADGVQINLTKDEVEHLALPEEDVPTEKPRLVTDDDIINGLDGMKGDTSLDNLDNLDRLDASGQPGDAHDPV